MDFKARKNRLSFLIVLGRTITSSSAFLKTFADSMLQSLDLSTFCSSLETQGHCNENKFGIQWSTIVRRKEVTTNLILLKIRCRERRFNLNRVILL